MWLLLLAGAGIAVLAARSAAPSTSTTSTSTSTSTGVYRPLVALTRRVSGGPVPLTAAQQAAAAICNQIANPTQRQACLFATDPNVFCAQASSNPDTQAQCLDYAADPCGKLLDNPTAQAACRAGLQDVLSGNLSVEKIVRIQVTMGATAGCAAYLGPQAGPICADIAGKIYDAIVDAFGSDPPTDDQFALMVLQLARGTYTIQQLSGGTTSSPRYVTLPKYNDQTTVERVRYNLKALGLNKVWNLPGGAAQARDLVKIVLGARNHLHHYAAWWVVKRSAAELK